LYSRDLAYIHDTAFGDVSRGTAPEIIRILRQAHINAGRVVEVGCGSGLLAQRLTAAGYDVLGFDVSRSMIRLARRRAPAATFRVASLTRARIPPCRAVVSVGEVVTYVRGGLPELRRFFERVHAALAPGGLLLFDFLHSARGRTYPAKTVAGRGWTMAVRADYNARTRVLTRHMAIARRVGGRVRRFQETHRVRVYNRRALVSALERIGFDVRVSRSIGEYRLMTGDSAVIARRL